MKKLFITALMLLSLLQNNKAGILYTMTADPGTGHIVRFNTATNACDAVFSMPSGSLAPLYGGRLVKAGNGLLYTVAVMSSTYGEIVSFNNLTDSVTPLAVFDSATGGLSTAGPRTSVTLASNGLLYGMTNMFGANNAGTVFSFNTTTNTFTKLADFNLNATGGAPVGDLFEANNGLLYGVTQAGGTLGYGTLFSFNTANNTITKVASFDSINTGYWPTYGSPYSSVTLTQAGNGLLYGMANGGGAGNVGWKSR